MISEPITLMEKVPTGNGLDIYLLIAAPMPYRAMLPAAPPMPTNKKALKFKTNSFKNPKVRIYGKCCLDCFTQASLALSFALN